MFKLLVVLFIIKMYIGNSIYLKLRDTCLPLKKILRKFCTHLIIQCNLQLYLLTFNSSNRENIKTINNRIDYYEE